MVDFFFSGCITANFWAGVQVVVMINAPEHLVQRDVLRSSSSSPQR